MAWLIIELLRVLHDSWRSKQEDGWRDRLIDLGAEKKISRIQTDLVKTRVKLTETEAELQKVKAGLIWSKIPDKEDRKNGSDGVTAHGTGKAETGEHT